MSLFHRSEKVGDAAAVRADEIENRTAENRAVDHADDRVDDRFDDRVDERFEDRAEDRAEDRVADDRVVADRADETRVGRVEDRAVEDRAVEDRAAEERVAEERAVEDDAAGASSYRDRASSLGLDREAVLRREKERFGGVKPGAAFFGFLAATGTGVLVTALFTGAGAAAGAATNTSAGEAVDQARRNVTTVGVAGAIGLFLVLLLAYYCGGYVAGRMARFSGIQQGVAVWVVGVLVAVGVAVLGVVTGQHYDLLGTLNNFPKISVNGSTLTGGAVTAVLLAAVVSLIGAVLGGLAGMRYHRKVDRVGLGV